MDHTYNDLIKYKEGNLGKTTPFFKKTIKPAVESR